MDRINELKRKIGSCKAKTDTLAEKTMKEHELLQPGVQTGFPLYDGYFDVPQYSSFSTNAELGASDCREWRWIQSHNLKRVQDSA
jgi:hypothetical protein